MEKRQRFKQRYGDPPQKTVVHGQIEMRRNVFKHHLVLGTRVEPSGPGTFLATADGLILASESEQVVAVRCLAGVIRRCLVLWSDPRR